MALGKRKASEIEQEDEANEEPQLAENPAFQPVLSIRHVLSSPLTVKHHVCLQFLYSMSFFLI